MTIALLQVRLRRIAWEATDINSFEFTAPDGRELPPFAAGAHVDVHLPGGLVRQYSLCNPPDERHRYVIAVQKDARGRGGSRGMHERVREGDVLVVKIGRAHV